MKTLFVTVFILTYLTCEIYGLSCMECKRSFEPECNLRGPKVCEPERNDLCVDVYYPVYHQVNKECMNKEDLDNCKNNKGGTLCVTCKEDLCNELYPEDFQRVIDNAQKTLQQKMNEKTQ